MIVITDGHYVVNAPEYGVYQDVDPSTGRPFANEQAARSWWDTFFATVQAAEAAAQAAEQARQAAILHLVIVPTDARVALGTPVAFTVTMKNGLDQVTPLNDDFAVPIENERGEVVMIKLATFVNGQATVNLQPPRSGYYCITEEGINRRLPTTAYLRLPEPVEVVVYE